MKGVYALLEMKLNAHALMQINEQWQTVCTEKGNHLAPVHVHESSGVLMARDMDYYYSESQLLGALPLLDGDKLLLCAIGGR